MPTGPRPAPPAGTARVAIQGRTLGHQYASVFYLELTHSAAVTVSDLQDIADYIETQWVAHQATQISSDVTLDSVDVRFIPTSGSELRYTGTYTAAGANGASVQDASACMVVDFVISDYYRGGHPRIYQPGVVATNVTNGSDISAPQQSGIVGGWNAFRNALNAHTTTNVTAIVMGTVRFASGNAWLSPPRFVAYTSVKSGKRGKLGSQRRRILT